MVLYQAVHLNFINQMIYPMENKLHKGIEKKKNECQFCKSIHCFQQIYRDEEPKYDEVYCNKHIKEAEKACDEVLGIGNGLVRTHRSSSGRISRGSR